MFWNIWIIGLLFGELAVFVIFTVAAYYSLQIIKYWDPGSLSSFQLELEHKSELVSTVMFWTLVFQIFSLFVLVYAADSISSSIPGAMCAVGVFQNSKVGWYAISVKIIGLFLYGWWLYIQKWDEYLEGYPLTVLKSKYLLAIYLFFILDFLLEFLFFFNLNPQVVTSCCGVIFGVGSGSSTSFLITLPPRFMEVFTLLYFAFLALLGFRVKGEKDLLLYGVFSLVGLVVGILAVISFVAPYIYVEPTVHCPFCLIKPENYYYGYFIYIALFLGAFFGSSSLLYYILVKKEKRLSDLAHKMKGTIRLSSYLHMAFLILIYAPVVKFFIDMGGFRDLFKGVY